MPVFFYQTMRNYCNILNRKYSHNVKKLQIILTDFLSISAKNTFIKMVSKFFLINILEVETITQETIKVEGMSCGHCVMRVKKAIEDVQGVKKVDVSLENKQAVVEFDEEKTDVEKIKAAVRESGYELA